MRFSFGLEAGVVSPLRAIAEVDESTPRGVNETSRR
jgi:hypothetical protein